MAAPPPVPPNDLAPARGRSATPTCTARSTTTPGFVCAEALEDERAVTATAFWHRAVAFFAADDIVPVRRVLTDTAGVAGPAFRLTAGCRGAGGTRRGCGGCGDQGGVGAAHLRGHGRDPAGPLRAPDHRAARRLPDVHRGVLDQDADRVGQAMPVSGHPPAASPHCTKTTSSTSKSSVSATPAISTPPKPDGLNPAHFDGPPPVRAAGRPCTDVISFLVNIPELVDLHLLPKILGQTLLIEVNEARRHRRRDVPALSRTGEPGSYGTPSGLPLRVQHDLRVALDPLVELVVRRGRLVQGQFMRNDEVRLRPALDDHVAQVPVVALHVALPRTHA